jgi:selenocysteine lyase/cysteine desulfurase
VTADQIVERLAKAITPATRAVGVTWVHSSTGLKLPIARIADAVRAANAGRDAKDRCLLIVDGVHGLGVEDVAVAELGADFFAAGLHKWMFGPRGTGVLYGKADAWPLVRPSNPSFEAGECWAAFFARQPLPPTKAPFFTRGGFFAFEHLLALPAAIGLHQHIGRARIARRIAELNGRFREALAAMPGVTLHTPRDPALASGLVAFEASGVKPAEIVERLKAKRIHATESPYRVPYARVSAGIMVQPHEIETTIAALRQVTA